VAVRTREIYRSANGDRWLLARDPDTGRVFVRHEPNLPSGGQVADIEIGAFLIAAGEGPEKQELLRQLEHWSEVRTPPGEERGHITRADFRRPRVEQPDHRHYRPLRARRERPRNRAAEQRDELAPLIKKTSSHGTIAKCAGLTKRPRSPRAYRFHARGSAESRWAIHSMTSSARRRNDSGIVSPSAFAVLRLITNSNLIGRSIGKSATLAPLRIRST
jgi:hypothetical protein